MQINDAKPIRIGLNTDDNPSELKPGEYVGARNIRTGSSDETHGEGPAETLQSEIEILINPDSAITYYGQAIGGQFIYSGYSEIQIGSQVWMRKNWDSDYPGSKVYNDDVDNASIYGRLFTHNQIMSSDFCPEGWHVPTEAEFDTLLAYLGGLMIAGGRMKEVGDSHWNDPNTGASDNYGFRAIPGGKFDLLFDLIGENCLLWIRDDGVPYAPEALNASNITYESFVANWLAVEGADGYKVTYYGGAIGLEHLYSDIDVGDVLSFIASGLDFEAD
jgi:uncharacterized protein (TIGR02145 family)